MADLMVKICGITRVEDGYAACVLGADMVGFVLAPGSPRTLEPGRAREIIRALPPSVSKVGVFVDEEAATVNRLADFLGLDLVQLHGDEDPSLAKGIALPVIRAVRVGGAADIARAEDLPCHALLLDARVEGRMGGTGHTFSWSLAAGICLRRPVFVAGGLTPDNVGEAVRLLLPYGVDASSGVECSPGIKDHGKMERFIREARAAARKGEERSHDAAGR